MKVMEKLPMMSLENQAIKQSFFFPNQVLSKEYLPKQSRRQARP
jgi:hypothetical protein